MELNPDILGSLDFQEAGRATAVVIDFGVGRVMADDNLMLKGECYDALEKVLARHGRGRIIRRIHEHELGPPGHILRDGVEVRQETGSCNRRQINRLAIGRHRAGGIGRIEGIGNQHGWAAASATDPPRRGDGGEKQSLARSVEHQDFSGGIDRPR